MAHLGYEKGKDAPASQTSRRNGVAAKVLKGQDGAVPVAVLQGRGSRFEPELVKTGWQRGTEWKTRSSGFMQPAGPSGRSKSHQRACSSRPA